MGTSDFLMNGNNSPVFHAYLRLAAPDPPHGHVNGQYTTARLAIVMRVDDGHLKC